MKKVILFLFIIFISSNIFAQDSPLLIEGKVSIDSFYKDKEALVIISEVAQFDSLNKATLIKKVKNWASIQFVNLKEILVSETDDQLVLNYINNNFYVKNGKTKASLAWYIRLIIQVKDGKIKCTYIDDGNTMVPGTIPNARVYHFKDYFKEEDAKILAPKYYTEGLLAIYQSVRKSFESLMKSLASDTVADDNW
jgi:hypothetical protein